MSCKKPQTVVAFDPGLRDGGIAVFEDGVLVHAALVRSPEATLRGPGAWRAMAQVVLAEIEDTKTPRPFVLVMEQPQVYPGAENKTDPDDLLQLAGVDGAVAYALQPDALVAYRPREWKGQVPKDIHNKRVVKRLTPAESAAIEPCPAALRHNILDAIGIGLFYLERMD